MRTLHGHFVRRRRRNHIHQAEHIDFKSVQDDPTKSTHWFGGDDRQGIQRNVGVGQGITFLRTACVKSVGFEFKDMFDYRERPDRKGHEVTLVLNVRTDDGLVIHTAQTTVPPWFRGGLVDFEPAPRRRSGIWFYPGQEYIFTCYLHEGDQLELASAAPVDLDDRWPCSTGYVANVLSKPWDMEDWRNWRRYPGDFHFCVSGFYADATPCDFDHNDVVGLLDLAAMTQVWLRDNCHTCDWCKRFDVNWSGEVNFHDFAVLAEYWRKKYDQ